MASKKNPATKYKIGRLIMQKNIEQIYQKIKAFDILKGHYSI